MRDHNRYGYPGTGSSGNEHYHIQRLKDAKWSGLSSVISQTQTVSHPHGTLLVSAGSIEVPVLYNVCEQKG